MAAGRQVLFLVPEISLTPQLVRRLLGRIEARFALFHSGRNEGERERAWLAAARGEADILVGTRSALFTPLPRLGLVVVDEEHDPSFKQQEGFRYSARDLALVKARLAACPVVLGSATPSLESVANVTRGRYRRLHLPERAGGAANPAMALVDMRAQRLEGGLAPPSAARDARRAGSGQPGSAVSEPPRLCARAHLPRLRLGGPVSPL